MMLLDPKGHPLLKQTEVPFRVLDGVAPCGPVRPNALTTTLAAHTVARLARQFPAG